MTHTPPALTKVDHAGLRFGMVSTIVVLIVAFIVNAPGLVALVALAQLLAAVDAPFAPYRVLYGAARQRGWLTPNVRDDNAQPHRFASLVGGLFNSAAVVALLAGAPALGWALVAVVVALANVNYWLHFCVGCWVYYQLGRLGVPGFAAVPVGTVQR